MHRATLYIRVQGLGCIYDECKEMPCQPCDEQHVENLKDTQKTSNSSASKPASTEHQCTVLVTHVKKFHVMKCMYAVAQTSKLSDPPGAAASSSMQHTSRRSRGHPSGGHTGPWPRPLHVPTPPEQHSLFGFVTFDKFSSS